MFLFQTDTHKEDQIEKIEIPPKDPDLKEDSLSLLEDEFLPEVKDGGDPLIQEFDDSLSLDKQSIEIVSDNLLEDADLDAVANCKEGKRPTRTIRVLGESASSGSSTPSATPSPCGSRTNR